MGDMGKRAAGTNYLPDMEDWWGDVEPSPVPSRQQRPRRRANFSAPLPPYEQAIAGESRQLRRRQQSLSKILMYITLAVLLVGLFIQINRYAQMASQTKRIAALVSEIKTLEGDRDNLRLRLTTRDGSLKKLRETAETKLGMKDATEEQMRVIQVAGLSGSQTQTAAIPAD